MVLSVWIAYAVYDTEKVGHLMNISILFEKKMSFKHCFPPDGLKASDVSQPAIMSVILSTNITEIFTRWPTITVSHDTNV